MTDEELRERARAILDDDYIQVHRHSINHRAEVEASALCVCFYCFAKFPPSAIRAWVDFDRTALCPECKLDSVVGMAAGYKMDAPEFLQGMHDYWFADKKKPRS